MKWILHKAQPAVIWWYCQEGDEAPVIELIQNPDGTWNWYRHTSVERDGVSPDSDGPIRSLRRAKMDAMQGMRNT